MLLLIHGAAFQRPLKYFLVSSTFAFAQSLAFFKSICSSKDFPGMSPPSLSASVGERGEVWAPNPLTTPDACYPIYSILYPPSCMTSTFGQIACNFLVIYSYIIGVRLLQPKKSWMAESKPQEIIINSG